MKEIKRILGYASVVLFASIIIIALILEGGNLGVDSFSEMIDIIFTKIFNLGEGGALQIITKISLILFLLSMTGLPIACLVMYIIRRRKNQGSKLTDYILRMVLAWLAMGISLFGFRHLDKFYMCIVVLCAVCCLISYFILSLIIILRSKAYIDINSLMSNEEVNPNIVGEEYSAGSIDIEHDDDEINPADMDNEDDFFIPGVSKTFEEKFAMADEELRKNYSILKNELLVYSKMTCRKSKSYEAFRLGQYQMAKIAIRGKKIKLFLAMDPLSIDDNKYHQSDYSTKKKYEATPCCLNVKSKRSVANAVELIKFTCGQIRAHRNEKYKEVDYSIIPEEKKEQIPDSLTETAKQEEDEINISEEE